MIFNRSYCVASVYCILAEICLVYSQYFNKSSLTFVIDETNLMVNETEEVKSGIDSILETVRMSTASQIQHFVLVTFDDPEYTLHVVTKNRKAVSKVYVRTGNPQYPENVTTGIKVAIENSLPYSTVYVITDASAKDSEIYEEVKSMAQKKQIQVAFVVTSECGSGENNKCKGYNQLAEATDGEVFNLMKNDNTDILEYVKESSKSKSDIIAFKKFPPGYGHKLEFFVPTEMDELIISVNGLEPKVEVTDSEGNKVDIGWWRLKYEIAIIKVSDLKLGVYIADVGSTSETHVKIMGNSTDHFSFGFSPFETCLLSDTATRPALDEDAYSSMKLQGEGVKLETVQIIDTDGNILEELPLLLNNEIEGFYVNKSFNPLNVPFQLTVSGFIKKKHVKPTSLTPIGRQSEIFVAPVIQDLYAIKIFTCVTGDLGLRIQCNPTGYPRPLILWKKDGIDIVSVSKSFDIEEGALILKNIEKSQQGTYTCLARNKIGNDISVFTVNVNDYPIVPKIESSMLIDPGTSFDVPCDIKDNKTDFIRWYKDSRLIAYGKLTLNNISHLNSGIYSCRVGDMWESSTSHVKIKIGYGPYFYTKEMEIIPFKERRKYHLICSATGLPEPKITWSHNGKTLGISSMIHTIKMTLSNRGNYTCEISNCYGNIKRSFLIISQVPPTIEKPKLSTIDLLVDTDLILQCNADGHPEPQIQWFFQEFDTKATPRTLRSNVNTKEFNLPRVQLKDQGYYTCEASNIGGKTNITYTVNVNAPLKIEKPKFSTIDLLVNTDLILQCNADGHPEPQIKWLFQEFDTKDTPRILRSNVNTKEFNLPRVQIKDQGNYTCEASNIGGKTNITYTVNVNVPPTIEKPKLSTIDLLVDTDLILQCNADGHPEPQIQWFFQAFDTKATPRTLRSNVNTKEFNLPRVQLKDQGYYTCEASNIGGKTNITYTVNVNAPLKIEKPKFSTIDLLVNTDLILQCNADGHPEPQIKWLFQEFDTKDTPRILRSNVNTKEFNLPRVQIKDQGNYTCEASNIGGKTNITYTVNVNVPPTIEKPKFSTIDLLVDTDLILQCNADGHPEPQIKWLFQEFDTKDIPRILRSNVNTKEFNLPRVQLKDQGYYTCEASNIGGKTNITYTVNVNVPPTIEKPKFSTIDLLVDTDLILQCNADGHPEPQIKWLFQEFDTKDTPRTLRSNVNTKEFNLPRVQIKDQGNYTCEASNIGGKTNITYTVNVNAVPSIQNLYAFKTFTCVTGDLGLRIQCKATGYPKPSIVWKKDGSHIVSGSKWFDIEEGALIIKNIEKSQQGNYICLARNRIGHDSSVYTVIVNDYPIVPKIESSMFIDNGTSFDVPCDIKHNDTDFIRWYKDSRLIAHGKLTLKNISPLVTGIYSCRVGDMWESTSSHVEIKIGYKPYFTTKEKEKIPFFKGRSHPLSCVARGQPEPKVTWTYNGKTLSLSKMTAIIEMTMSNRGNYTCEISNSFGSITRSFRFIAEECMLDIKKDFLHKNQPMMLTPHKTWPVFTIVDGYIVIGKGEPIFLNCPGKFDKFNKYNMMAYCVGETQIRINDKIYEYSKIECRQEIKPVINKSTKLCLLGKGITVEVGYKIFNRFLNFYDVCLDTNKNVPLYTQHVLTPDQYNVSTNKNVWWPYYLLPYNFDTIYNCTNQAHDLSSILEKPFHYSDECCFGKRQLVSPMDFAPGLPETIAHTYLNVVPHWSTCNSKNWAEIEQNVRNLAKLLNRKLTVLTGTAEPLVMQGRKGLKKITIHDDRNKNLAVAQFLWKVVQDPKTESSLAIIQINVPDLSPKDIPLQIRCTDICEEIEWMKGTNWQNIASGYTYCCTIDDFERAFNFRGEFGRGNTKVLNMRSDTPAYTDYSDYSDY